MVFSPTFFSRALASRPELVWVAEIRTAGAPLCDLSAKRVWFGCAAALVETANKSGCRNTWEKSLPSPSG